MANNMIEMKIIRQIILLLEKGRSERSIQCELKISRTTIRDYIARFKTSAKSYPELLGLDDAGLAAFVYPEKERASDDPRKTDFETRIAYFFAELKRTGVTRLLLWKEYKKQFPDGYQYTMFCQLLKQQAQVKGASMHLVHKPAEMMMIDFAGDMLYYTDQQSGEMIACPVLVCVLPFSGYSYAVALPNAKLPMVIKGLNQCLRFIKGVPHLAKCDNMKQIVTKSCKYEPVFTEAIGHWAMHNRTGLVAARVRKPKDKALVENEVKLVYQRVYAPLRNQVFFSIEELNAAIVARLEDHHRQAFQRKDHTRLECFVSQELPLLQALPDGDFQICHSVEAKVQKNYHVTLGEDWHHYSVPFAHIGKKVKAVYDADTVEIYLGHERIALHKRNYKKHNYSTVKEHMPEGHQRYFEQRGWTPEYFIGQAGKIGHSAQQYVQQMLKAKTFTEQTYNACRGILRLEKVYGPQRIEAACKRALQSSHCSYRTIQSILDKNLDKEEDSSENTKFSTPLHDNLRGAVAYQ